jgi:hypothetical protein
MRVVAESGRDYRRSILVGSVLRLCELLLTATADQLTTFDWALASAGALFFVPKRQLFAGKS